MITREAVKSEIDLVEERYLKTLMAINLAELIRTAIQYHNTLKIQYAEGTAVLMSEAASALICGSDVLKF
jgi:hypothetical protein